MSEGAGEQQASWAVDAPLERVRDSFRRQGLMRLLGAEVVEAGEGWCVIEVPFHKDLTQQESFFHGAVTGAISDNADGYAALTLARRAGRWSRSSTRSTS